MTLHKEGKASIAIVLAVVAVLTTTVYYTVAMPFAGLAYLVLWAFMAFILYFFRIPNRKPKYTNNTLLAPADGKIVAIEECTENEYFNDKRILVSIFMSPLNVHVNLYPADGTVEYFKYHPGKFYVASLPKSATDNERTTTVIKTASGKEILIRQVAGAVARRIVSYAKTGDQVKQCAELGFIKFGSRVDMYLPIDTQINVKIGQHVKGKLSTMAKW